MTTTGAIQRLGLVCVILLSMISAMQAQSPLGTIQFDPSSDHSAVPVSGSEAYGSSVYPGSYSRIYPSESIDPWQEPVAGSTPDFGPAMEGNLPASGNGGNAGAGAGDAVNPGAPLSQIQFQNVFIPESYQSSGYSNQFIIQPVISVNRKPGSYFDYHIIRPTLPILEPNPDPDGPVGDLGGIGDLTYIDIFVHQTQKEGVIWGVGPIAVLPTSSNRQSGLGEWQLGPSFAVLDSSKKHWVLGALAEVPFSLESDAYSVLFQPVLTRLLSNDRYVGVGDLLWKFDDHNGNYNIPLSFRVGKVFKFGKQPINIFVQPQYTPVGLTSQPTAKYGIKLSVTLLLPGAEFGYSKD